MERKKDFLGFDVLVGGGGGGLEGVPTSSTNCEFTNLCINCKIAMINANTYLLSGLIMPLLI